MSPDEASAPKVCTECGAALKAGEAICWLCGAALKPNALPAAGAVSGHPVRSFGLSTLMLIVTLAAVCFGAFQLYPGLGMLVAILLAPVFVRTSMVVSRREAAGEPVPLWQRITLFLGSFGTVIVMVTMVCVASVGTFCTVCLGVGKEEAIVPAAFIALAATVAVLALIVKWVRYRWRRDIRVR